MFTNMVTTNGFQLSLHFARPAKSPGMELELSDFKEEEIENYFMPCALDPGRRDIFQAAYGAQNTEHEIRRSSTREYYQWTGSPKRNENLKKARKRNGIEEIESNFPSAKTADITRYSEYVRYLFLHLETLFTFYCFDNDAERRFRAYQGKQRAQEELVNVIVNGGKKYNSAKRKHRRRNRRERKKQKRRRKLFKRRRRNLTGIRQ